MADHGGPSLVQPLINRAPHETRVEARRVLNVMLLYIAVVFIVAAVMAPWLYRAVQQFAPDSYLAQQPFHRYVNRGIIILSLLGLVPLLRELRLKVSLADLGLRRANLPDLLVGLLWGFGILAVLIAFALGFGARVPDFSHSGGAWVKHLKNAVLAAMVVSLIEELLFRGALFSGLRRGDTFVSAALVSSFLYGIVHFFERPANPEYIDWNSGLIVLARMLRGFTDWHALVPGLINLTLLGVILCLAFERTKSLLFSIGLHASIIFWLKTANFLTDNSQDANTWFWGTGKIVDGWACFVLLSGLLLLLHRSLRANVAPPATEPYRVPMPTL